MLSVVKIEPSVLAPSAEAGKGSELRLDALTSLRFFAAVMIVLYHFSSMVCQEIAPSIRNLALYQGVSFFYVLSGFILTYVYPRLSNWSGIFAFLKARFARVYPTHILGLALSAVLTGSIYSGTDFWQLIMANLFLVQDWLPIPAFYFSFNAPAWSISCEFFFYLCFPILILGFNRTWYWKLSLCALITIASIFTANALSLPGGSNFSHNVSGDWFTTFSPLTRLFEFTVGMSTALIYANRGKTQAIKVAYASMIEAALIFCIIICARTDLVTVGVINHLHLPIKACEWIFNSCGAPLYGALIYMFACRVGLISKFLGKHPFVLFGEISYAMYLLHCPMMQFLSASKSHLSLTPSHLIYAGFWIALLSGSYLSFELIEKPFRNLILGKRYGLKKMLKPATILNATILLALCLGMVSEWRRSDDQKATLSATEAQAMKASMPAAWRGIAFGGKQILEAYSIRSNEDGATVKLFWRSFANQALDLKVGFHLLDATNEQFGGRDYLASSEHRRVKVGEYWVDEITVDAENLPKLRRIGICIYDPNSKHALKALSIDRGSRDWENQRLLIDFPSN